MEFVSYYFHAFCTRREGQGFLVEDGLRALQLVQQVGLSDSAASCLIKRLIKKPAVTFSTLFSFFCFII
jgi:hypothetical protein